MTYSDSVRISDSLIASKSGNEIVQQSRHKDDFTAVYDDEDFFICYEDNTKKFLNTLPTFYIPTIDQENYKSYSLSKSDFGDFTKQIFHDNDFSNFESILVYELGRSFDSGYDFCPSTLKYDLGSLNNFWYYVSTSGTILLVEQDSFQVFLPIHRIGGTTDGILAQYQDTLEIIYTEAEYDSERIKKAKKVFGKTQKPKVQRKLVSRTRDRGIDYSRTLKYTLSELV